MRTVRTGGRASERPAGIEGAPPMLIQDTWSWSKREAAGIMRRRGGD
jgi:hypothetical protein